MHLCGVCWQDSGLHVEDCFKQGCETIVHWPPLCCSECPCGSYEEAHGMKLEEDHVG